MVEVLAALGTVPIRSGWLEDEDDPESMTIFGVCEPTGNTSTVRINEAAHIVDTIIHEILHHLRPAWTETTVRRFSTRLYRQLQNDEVQRIYDIYLGRVARSRKRAI